jgi:hypothetical protein
MYIVEQKALQILLGSLFYVEAIYISLYYKKQNIDVQEQIAEVNMLT